MSQTPRLSIESFLETNFSTYLYANQISKHIRENHALIEHPHKHDFFLLLIFTQGTGTHQIDFVDYSVQAGSVFLLHPGQIHSWELSEDCDGIILFHSHLFQQAQPSEEKSALYHTPFISPKIQLTAENTRYFTPLFNQICEEMNRDLIYKNQYISNCIINLYIEIIRKNETNFPQITTQTKAQRNAHLFHELVEEFILTEHTTQFYAQKMNITDRHLNRIVQHSFGMSTMQFIHKRLIIEAKRMILENRHSLVEISNQLGFGEYAYFSTFFKKKTGLNPKQFREMIPN